MPQKSMIEPNCAKANQSNTALCWGSARTAAVSPDKRRAQSLGCSIEWHCQPVIDRPFIYLAVETTVIWLNSRKDIIKYLFPVCFMYGHDLLAQTFCLICIVSLVSQSKIITTVLHTARMYPSTGAQQNNTVNWGNYCIHTIILLSIWLNQIYHICFKQHFVWNKGGLVPNFVQRILDTLFTASSKRRDDYSNQ